MQPSLWNLALLSAAHLVIAGETPVSDPQTAPQQALPDLPQTSNRNVGGQVAKIWKKLQTVSTNPFPFQNRAESSTTESSDTGTRAASPVPKPYDPAEDIAKLKGTSRHFYYMDEESGRPNRYLLLPRPEAANHDDPQPTPAQLGELLTSRMFRSFDDRNRIHPQVVRFMEKRYHQCVFEHGLVHTMPDFFRDANTCARLTFARNDYHSVLTKAHKREIRAFKRNPLRAKCVEDAVQDWSKRILKEADARQRRLDGHEATARKHREDLSAQPQQEPTLLTPEAKAKSPLSMRKQTATALGAFEFPKLATQKGFQSDGRSHYADTARGGIQLSKLRQSLGQSPQEPVLN